MDDRTLLERAATKARRLAQTQKLDEYRTALAELGFAYLAAYPTKRAAAKPAQAPKHVCGAQGFGALGDHCPGCEARDKAALLNIESPFNACMHREHCLGWKAAAAALAEPPADGGQG